MLYIIRYSEIGVKSDKSRSFFEKLLTKNIADTLKNRDANLKISRDRGRIYLETNYEKVSEVLEKIFGISSFSPVVRSSINRKELVNQAAEYAKINLVDTGKFAVRCRRVGDHPYTSREIEVESGARIIQVYQGKIKVDLKRPDKTIFIEAREKEAYIYHRIIPGLGGLPTGSQGKFVSLISGGIDSPVSTYLMMKRGCQPILLHFDNKPYCNDRNIDKVLKIAGILRQYASGREVGLYIAPYGEILQHITDSIPRSKYICLICKRNMLKIAEKLAIMLKAEGIITGESIGQKASQTLTNILVTTKALYKIPIHRPLITYDKLEIEATAKKIGTYEASIETPSCCSCVPAHPSINASLKTIENVENSLGLESLIEEAIHKTRKVKYNSHPAQL